MKGAIDLLLLDGFRPDPAKGNVRLPVAFFSNLLYIIHIAGER
jgi:hypothetical protein